MVDNDAARAEGRGPSVIVNVIDVLRCFTVDEPQQGVTGIAEKVGLHKSTVSRILSTLEEQRIVERDEPSRKYRLGLGLIAVAGPLLANLDVRRVAMDDLHELAEQTGETAALTIWDGEASVTVEQVPSRHLVKHTSAMGSRYATGMSASVQVFLAHLHDAETRQLVESGRVHFEGEVTTSGYLERLAAVREQGFAVNHGQASPEEVGIAAPVRDHRGEVVAAVMIAAPYYRVPEAALPEMAQTCRRTARGISRRLGATAAQ